METITENYFEKNLETGGFEIRTRKIPKPELTKIEIIEKIIADEIVDIPENIRLENKVIGEIIQKKVYDDNVNAELADLAEGVLKIIAVLVPII